MMNFPASQRVVVGVLLLAGAIQAAAQCGGPAPAKQERRGRGDYDVAAMFKMHLNPVSAEFTTAAQPTNEILKEYKDKGYKAVINFREPHEHDSAGEIAAAKQLGLRYYNIPVDYPNPKFEQATEFLKLTDDAANRPALIHCTVNIRQLILHDPPHAARWLDVRSGAQGSGKGGSHPRFLPEIREGLRGAGEEVIAAP